MVKAISEGKAAAIPFCEYYELRGVPWCRYPRNEIRVIFPPARQCKGDVTLCPFRKGVDVLTWFCPGCKATSSVPDSVKFITDTIEAQHKEISPECHVTVYSMELYYA